jgi:DNA topoisomerase-1
MTYARIGNEEYARQNGSFGLTTLRDRHVTISGSTVRFLFKGKSGREIEVGVTNRRVAKVVKRCEELPGQMLFQYIGADSERHTVHSDDVNQYLQEISGEDFTAKDYRTWSATVLATSALRDLAQFESDAEAKRNVVAAIDSVARTRAWARRRARDASGDDRHRRRSRLGRGGRSHRPPTLPRCSGASPPASAGRISCSTLTEC